MFCRNSLVVQWLGLLSLPRAWSLSSVLNQGTKIPQAVWPAKKKRVLLNVRILVDRVLFCFVFLLHFKCVFNSLLLISLSAMPHDLRDLGSLIRDWTWALGSESVESYWTTYHWTAREVLLLLISRVSPLVFNRLTMICEGVDPFAFLFWNLLSCLGV